MIQSTVLPEIIHELNDLEDLVKKWRSIAEWKFDTNGGAEEARILDMCAVQLEFALNVIFKRHMTPPSSTA